MAAISDHINDILDELKTIHIKFTQDDLAGLVLQNSLASEPQLAKEFDCHVEMAYQSSAKAHVMYLDTMICIINVIHHVKAFSQPACSSTSSSTPPLALCV